MVHGFALAIGSLETIRYLTMLCHKYNAAVFIASSAPWLFKESTLVPLDWNHEYYKTKYANQLEYLWISYVFGLEGLFNRVWYVVSFLLPLLLTLSSDSADLFTLDEAITLPTSTLKCFQTPRVYPRELTVSKTPCTHVGSSMIAYFQSSNHHFTTKSASTNVALPRSPPSRRN